MKKFKLCYFSDTRAGFELENVVDVEFEKGRDVFNFVVEGKKKDREWVSSIKEWMGEFKESDLLEGSIDSSIFNILMGEESGCLVLESYKGIEEVLNQKGLEEVFYNFIDTV